MQGYPDREVSHEYVRCSDDAPCTVASDLCSRVRELEKGLTSLWGTVRPPGATMDNSHMPPYLRRWVDRYGVLLTTPTKEVMPHTAGLPAPNPTPAPVVTSAAGAAFMLPAPMPATPIPPDPRDAVVEAADDYERLWIKVHESGGATRDDRVRIGHVRGHLFAAIRALRATEGRG